MASQTDRVVTELRRRILAGELPAGYRVVEVEFSKDLQVSRTPLRIALGELEKEGLLERLPTRGFRVRSFTLQQIVDAVDVRGILEGMAARLACERGLGSDLLAEFKTCLTRGQQIVDTAFRRSNAIDAQNWSDMNLCFHTLLVQGSCNSALQGTLQFVSRTPMAGAGALTLQGLAPALETAFIQRAQNDHVDCVQALEARAGARAEAIMREHAFRSRENKKVLIARLSLVAEDAVSGEGIMARGRAG
jgi:GntR family transcriptional regulator of vanillate catabolism